MIDEKRFEALLEALDNEIEDIRQGSVRNNLIDIHSGLYNIYEDSVGLGALFERLEEENEVLKQVLSAYLSPEDKQYIKIKYDLEF